jgi:hypothetical protein
MFNDPILKPKPITMFPYSSSSYNQTNFGAQYPPSHYQSYARDNVHNSDRYRPGQFSHQHNHYQPSHQPSHQHNHHQPSHQHNHYQPSQPSYQHYNYFQSNQPSNNCTGGGCCGGNHNFGNMSYRIPNSNFHVHPSNNGKKEDWVENNSPCDLCKREFGDNKYYSTECHGNLFHCGLPSQVSITPPSANFANNRLGLRNPGHY